MLESAFTWAWGREEQIVTTDGNSALSPGQHNYKCYENTEDHEIRGGKYQIKHYFFFNRQGLQGKATGIYGRFNKVNRKKFPPLLVLMTLLRVVCSPQPSLPEMPVGCFSSTFSHFILQNSQVSRTEKKLVIIVMYIICSYFYIFSLKREAFWEVFSHSSETEFLNTTDIWARWFFVGGLSCAS